MEVLLCGIRQFLFRDPMSGIEHQIKPGRVSFDHGNDATLILRFSGRWHLDKDLPPTTEVIRALDARPAPKRVLFDTTESRELGQRVAFVPYRDRRVVSYARYRGGSLGASDRAAAICSSSPRRCLKRRVRRPRPSGSHSSHGWARQPSDSTASATEFITFVGQLTVAFSNLVRGKARYRTVDLIEVIQQCGASAVGIVTLISFLVGVILAFMGAVQLSQFGAAIYVADLVGIGMVREMGAMMTAIIMSGRTGAAFAAKLGTMKVTEEIDALTTMGISPLEFLVLPRVLALVLMMPLLCLYADFVGILGGMFVGVTMLGLSPGAYMRETISTLTMANLLGGLFKATFYGVLIAIAGCLRGFQCGNSSSAVGDAATQAVVMSIVLVVIACGTFAVLFNVLGI